MKKTAKSTTDLKAIKAALKLDGTIFNLKGKTSRAKNAEGVYVEVPEEFITSMHVSEYGDKKPLHSFRQNHWLSHSMNVRKFGSTKISLYTVTPFGKIVKQTLFIAHITIVSLKAQPTESESVAQPTDNQPVKTA